MLAKRGILLSLVWLAFLATAAGAVQRLDSDETGSGAVALPGRTRVRVTSPSEQARLESAPAWSSFRAAHGDWRAVWNEATQSPHRAFGRGVPLAGFADDAASADRAVRQFIRANPALFGAAPALDLLDADRAGSVWYVRYRPTIAGYPVLFSDWEFRVGTNGKLFAFGADVERPGPGVTSAPRIVGAVAREAAKQGLDFDPARDRVSGGEELFVLPLPSGDGTDYRLAYRTEVRTANPPGNWLAFVDASDGRVLWRQNRVRFDVGGTVTGTVHPSGPNDPLTAKPMPDLQVAVGASTVSTDAAGHYSGAGGDPVTVSAQLLGLYCDVTRDDGFPDASVSSSVANPSTFDIDWGSLGAPADESERDAYYHVNVAHAYVKSLEPGFAGLDYAMPTLVNIGATCNAFWDGLGVNFYAAGGGCPNTASIGDVVYHEYGHGVNDYVYLAHGSFSGMTNGALHEGMADVNAAFLRDDPRIGLDFLGVGTILRNIDNTAHYPEDVSGDPHATGQIVAGAFWDLRQAVGLAVAEHLAQFAKHGIPDDIDDGIAMFEFFTETLIADDDDANLSNGTPHSNEIVAAFNAHGIGTGFSIQITHAPLADRPLGVGSVPVTAQIQFSGPIGSLDGSSPTLHYSIDRGAYATAAMTPTGNPNEYSAPIAVPDTSVVEYYLTAGDTYGQIASVPRNAPGDAYTFVVGAPPTATLYDMETSAGWSGSAVGDNALTGRWFRGVPMGTMNGGIQVQSSEDHTPTPGTQCWVTANGPGGGALGQADVDGGHTTLTTPSFDAGGGYFAHPLVEYYRWYTNNQGSAPGTDFWRVDISNNGGTTWVPVENTSLTDNSWRRVVFRIEDFVPPTANMRMRFIASDEGDGSLVEAAVDDWRLLGYPGTLLAVEPGSTKALEFALAGARPNPFAARTTFRFSLPATARAALRVFDVNGRLVRILGDGVFDAGSHALAWDGRDAAGRMVASGTYFVKLEQAGRESVRAVVRVR